MSIIRKWVDDSACLKMDDSVFFPTGFLPHIVRRKEAVAKKICRSCVVRSECLADAVAWPPALDPDGIRGGLTADERITYRRRNNIKSPKKAPRVRGLVDEDSEADFS